MNITIQSVKFKESGELNDFVREKVEKLFQLSPEIIRIDVSLKVGAVNNPANKWCSLYISHPGENRFVKKKSGSFEESVIQATEAMQKILRRQKTKRVNQRNDPHRQA